MDQRPKEVPRNGLRRGARRVLGGVVTVACCWLVGADPGDNTGPDSAAGEPIPTLPPMPPFTPPDQPVVGLSTDGHLDKEPPRRTKGLDLVKLGWTYNCMDCHRLIESKWHYDRPMQEHAAVALSHGNNRFCLNCHHAENRNAFVDDDGSEIAEEAVAQLCGRCHGPTYRDWQSGVHGRRNGYWDKRRGIQTQLRCVQCHDPHAPSLTPVRPLPPPTYPARAANAPTAQTTRIEVRARPGSSHSDQ